MLLLTLASILAFTAGLQHHKLSDQHRLAEAIVASIPTTNKEFSSILTRNTTSAVRRFETCPALGLDHNAVSLVRGPAMPSLGGSSVVYSCNGFSKPCSCQPKEMLLYNFKQSKVHQSCCPIDTTFNSTLVCSGCAEVENKASCVECLGGFSKIQNSCVKCANEHKFMDKDGNTCATFARKGWCKDGRPFAGFESKAFAVYKHYSAVESCCVCGGGTHSGTPFEYRIMRDNELSLTLEDFHAVPHPRTANSYVLAPDCELSKFGLTIDGNTGIVSGTPTSDKPFETKCTITARTPKVGYMDSRINKEYREFNATLKVAINSFGYVPFDVDSESSTTAWRASSSLLFDESTFSRRYHVRWSNVVSAKTPSYSITCQPNSFIHIDQNTGTLSLGNITTLSDYKTLFSKFQGRMRIDPSHTPSASENLMQAYCHVVAKDSIKTLHVLDVKVFAYPPLSSKPIEYGPVSAVRVTVAQPIVTKLNLGYKNQNNKIMPIPGHFSTNVDCNSSIGLPVIHDLTSGSLTIQGLPVVNINPITGQVSGSPHVGLREFMPQSATRSYFIVACDVYAAVPSGLNEQVRLIKSPQKLVIQVDNDHCWVDAATYQSAESWKPMLKSSTGTSENTLAICKDSCMRNPSCAGFQYVSMKCYELVVAPGDQSLVTSLALKQGGVSRIKIANCHLHQTCVAVSVETQAYLTGVYCPLLSDGKSEAKPVYEMLGLHPQDTFYLMPYDKITDANAKLPSGCLPKTTAWVFRKASLKKDDIVDVEEGYLEMHGEVEGCITSEILKGPSVFVSLLDLTHQQHPSGSSNEFDYAHHDDKNNDFNLEDTMFIPSSFPTTFNKVPSSPPTNSKVVPSNSPSTSTNSPSTSPNSPAASISVTRRGVYDSVPFALTGGVIRGGKSKQVRIEVVPMGRTCQSPMLEENPEDEKSNTKQANGEEEQGEDDPAVTGLVKGGADKKEAVFRFDDPNTLTEFDFHLHPCECFFQSWGQVEPVTTQAFEAAAKGSIEEGMTFNRMSPDPVKLWQGPYICDLRFLIKQDFETKSCAMTCNDDAKCNYFVISDGVCMLFSDCEQMTRVDTNFIASTYAVHQRGKQNDICHIANPEKCWSTIRRRSYLTGIPHRFGNCMWDHLHRQCDFNKLMGDKNLEECAPCTYMDAKSQAVKRVMPSRFPHGARLSVDCSENYALLTSSSATNHLTCVDGEWRDDTGAIGLRNLQCAGCVQVFDVKSKAFEMVASSLEELLFIGARSIGLFMSTDNTYPDWIEAEAGTKISIMSRPKLGTFGWKLTLDRTTAMQLQDPFGKLCLAVRDYPIASAQLLQVLTLQKCVFKRKASLVQLDGNATSTSTSTSILEAQVKDQAQTETQSQVTGDFELQDGKQDKKYVFETSLAGKKRTRYPTKSPTKFPTQFPSARPTFHPTMFPVGDDKVLIMPSELFQRVAKQREVSAVSYSGSGWNCGSIGYIQRIDKTAHCLKRSRAPKLAENTPVVDRVYAGELAVKCGKGEAMYSISRQSSTYTAHCSPVPGLGECRELRFPTSQSVFDPFQAALGSARPVTCKSNQILGGFAAEEQSGKVKIILTCCSYPFYSGLALSSYAMEGFSPYEGQYCPTGYDDLLRPKFLQTTSYDLVNFKSLIEIDGYSTQPQVESLDSSIQLNDADEFGFESISQSKDRVTHRGEGLQSTLSAKRRRTLYPTKYPTNFPTNYPTNYPSKYPTPYPSPKPTAFPTPFPRPGATTASRGELKYDKTTISWCLHTSASNTCSSKNRDAEHPLDVDWLSEDMKGATFSVVPLNSMSGEGMTGDMISGGGAGSGRPKKPDLIKFVTENPEYSEGCIAIEEQEWKKASEVFDSSNPCGLVAGATWIRKNKDYGPGLNYEDLDKCSASDIERAWEMAQYDYNLGSSMLNKDLSMTLLAQQCSTLPNAEGGGGGGLAGPLFALFWDTDEQCSDTFETMDAIMDFALEKTLLSKTRSLEEAGFNDCDPVQNGLNRVLCDLHCVKDAVKAGTDTIIRNIALSNQNILENADLLMDYYAQLVMNKVEVEIGKIQPPTSSNLVSNPVTVTERLSASIQKYLTPDELTSQPASQINIQAAETLQTARHKTMLILNETLASLQNRVASTVHADKLIETAAEHVELVLGRAHEEAIKLQRHGTRTKNAAGGGYVKSKVEKGIKSVNRSLNYVDIGVTLRSDRLDVMERRGVELIQSVTRLMEDGQLTKEGAINWKLDIIENDVLINRAKQDSQAFHTSMRSIAQHWRKIKTHMNHYLESARELVENTRTILDEIRSYINCRSQNSFIPDATFRFNTQLDTTRQVLRATLPSVSSLLRDHADLMNLDDIIHRSIHAASSMVKLPHYSQGSSYWASSSGVREARKLMEQEVESMTLALAQQVLSMMAHARFLQVRAYQDGGKRMEESLEREISKSYIDILRGLKRQLSPLMTPESSLAVVGRMIDLHLPTTNGAPDVCKELAFDKHSDALTSTLITLNYTHFDGRHEYILTQPFFEKLTHVLSIATVQRITISKQPNNANRNDNANLVNPVYNLFKGIYVCTHKHGEGWELARAVDMPHDQSPTLCIDTFKASNSNCKAKDIRVDGYKALVAAADFSGKKGDAKLMDFWTKALKE